MNLKKWTAVLLAMLLLVSAASAFAEEGDLLSKIKERGVLIVGTEGVWSPWTFHDPDWETKDLETGELTGFDVEIARRIAAYLGVDVEIKEAEWSGLLAGVKAGRWDIVCNGVGLTEERAKSYSFSDPYIYSEKYLIVRSDNETITSLDDVAGLTSANSPGSTYLLLAQEYGATVIPTDAFQDCVQQLEQGRVDFTINSKASYEDYISQHPEAKIKVAAALPGDPVAFPVDNTEYTASFLAEVNAALAAMREDGSLAELCIFFMGEDLTNELPEE
ncbi:MAG: transporter substrate-binding domain-containing protein [Clostridia bacterium]|nr:transporter substrate-binding domain-containing protein [Clostridia bacterium]